LQIAKQCFHSSESRFGGSRWFLTDVGIKGVNMLVGFLFLGAVGWVLTRRSTNAESIDYRAWILAFVLSVCAFWFLRISSYIAFAGLVGLVISVTKLVPSKQTPLIRGISLIALVGALSVLGTKQFLSPYSGNWRQEDRIVWKPLVPTIQLSPTEILDRKWSASDPHADWPAAKLMLDLSRISYLDPVDARAELTKLGFESEAISNDSMNGYVAAIGDTAVIVFRGTEDGIGDLLQDLQFFKRTNDHGRIHGGFDRGYQGMHSQVEKLLVKYGTKRVWLTGHSLGGAIAIAGAYHLLDHAQVEIAGVMTYGQPMVVRQELADYLHSRLQDRYVFFVNDMDPIVKIVEPYVHFGHMVHDKDGQTFRVDSRRKLTAQTSQAPRSSGLPLNTELETMSDQSFNELIDRIDNANRPKFNEQGEPLVEGYLPDIYDHFLNSYDAMISRLVYGKDAEIAWKMGKSQ
jgi:triacylglycerol lipase